MIVSIKFRIGSGGFSTGGVTTANITKGKNITSVQCLSNHTTSFTVLVDVAGGLEVSNLQIKLIVLCIASVNLKINFVSNQLAQNIKSMMF